MCIRDSLYSFHQMAPAIYMVGTHPIPAHYSFIYPERMKGWVGRTISDGWQLNKDAAMKQSQCADLASISTSLYTVCSWHNEDWHVVAASDHSLTSSYHWPHGLPHSTLTAVCWWQTIVPRRRRCYTSLPRTSQRHEQACYRLCRKTAPHVLKLTETEKAVDTVAQYVPCIKWVYTTPHVSVSSYRDRSYCRTALPRMSPYAHPDSVWFWRCVSKLLTYLLILSPTQSYPFLPSFKNGCSLWLVRLLGTHTQYPFATSQTLQFVLNLIFKI